MVEVECVEEFVDCMAERLHPGNHDRAYFAKALRATHPILRAVAGAATMNQLIGSIGFAAVAGSPERGQWWWWWWRRLSEETRPSQACHALQLGILGTLGLLVKEGRPVLW
jgi:hypothetical protein